MTPCRLCGKTLETMLDFREQPLCNRFLARADEEEARFPLALGQCNACGLLQLIQPPPPEELLPRVDWIRYNEAEAHLDDLARHIASRIHPGERPTLMGVSYKDSSLLHRLRAKGFEHIRELTPESLGIHHPCAGIETIQHALTPGRAREIISQTGQADLLIARHILEHAHDMQAFMDALRTLLRPNGWLVLEVPDFSTSLDTGDYCTLWEEHVAYFTLDGFVWAMQKNGFDVQWVKAFPYPLENALVAICRFTDPGQIPREPPNLENLRRKANAYKTGFPARAERNRSALKNEIAARGPLVLFGAGHLAAKYINFFELSDLIDRVVDDHPHKKGLLMPGSKRPIVGSECLLDGSVRCCLTSLNPESEARVRARYAPFIEAGGQFASIFPVSENAIARA